MKLSKVLIFLSACALLAGCSKATNTNNTNVASNTTSPTPTTTASPGPTAEASKSPAELTAPGGKISKPEDAATGLFNAWKTKNRTEAAKFATNEAINSLFSEGGPEGLEFQGCDKQGDEYLCGYYYEGGGLIMVVKGNGSEGYKVTGTSFIAD
jgi:hypothetical protein